MDKQQITADGSSLWRLDRFMAANPWHPRVVPFAVYLVVLAGMQLVVEPYVPALWPAAYAVRCGLVVWLLWRYRRWLGELTWRFHWLAVPTGAGLLIVWLLLGWAMAGELDSRLAAIGSGELMGATEAGDSVYPQLPGSVFPLAVGLKLLGITLVVPMFEELFVRSALLRGLHNGRAIGTACIQFLAELPVVGERIARSDAGQRALAAGAVLTHQLERTPVGALSAAGVVGSTLIFTLGHAVRDWPAAIACALVWCALVWWTNRGSRRLGLGPVIWSHAITNALLWGYTIWSGDWQFI